MKLKKIPAFRLASVRTASLVILAAAAAACGGGDGGTTGPGPGPGPVVTTPASVSALRTPAATAAVGASTDVSPAVVVRAANNSPVSGVAVSFSVSGGGTITTSNATTNAAGEASPGTWQLGTTVGANTVTASVSGLSSVTFTVNTTAGAAASITPSNDNATTSAVGTTITPSVRVADTFGNAVAGAVVTFAPQNGAVATATATTDAGGIARVSGWTLATVAGSQRLNATSGSLSAAINVATTAAAASQVVRVAGDTQTGAAGSQVAVRPNARITDAFGNPIIGATVNFTIAEGNGSVTGGTQTTAADGTATVGSWTLGSVAGTNRLTATVPGGIASTFTATGNAGAFSAITIVSGNAQSSTVGAALPVRPAVRTHDSFGNAVAGVNVTFTIVSGGGVITGGTVTTGADGLATIGSWTLGNVAGANSITASATGATTATITATGVAGTATQLEKVSGDVQTAAAGGAVAVAPTVRVKDAFGNVKSGASVVFAVTGGNGSIAGGATKTTDANGVANVTTWTLGNTGANTLTATVGALVATFTATATAPAGVSSLVVVAGSAQNGTVGANVAVRPSVRALDGIGGNV
ncbi:MAG: hypothetical protein ABIS27_10435, partial [Longimicrobiales bacterium]